MVRSRTISIISRFDDERPRTDDKSVFTQSKIGMSIKIYPTAYKFFYIDFFLHSLAQNILTEILEKFFLHVYVQSNHISQFFSHGIVVRYQAGILGYSFC